MTSSARIRVRRALAPAAQAVKVLVASITVALGLLAGMGVTSPGPASASTSGPLPLQEYVNDGNFGRVWNAYNQSADANGPSLIGRVSPVTYGSSVQVFGREGNNDLVSYVNDGQFGRSWNAYDITSAAGAGVQLGGQPTAVVQGSLVNVFVRSSSGDLYDFANNGPGNQPWQAHDLSSTAGNGSAVNGDPAIVLFQGTLLNVYVQSNGHLVDYDNDNVGGRAWNAYDLSAVAGGGSGVIGDPAGVVYNGNTIHVYVRGSGGGLEEYVNDSLRGNLWNSYNLTAAAGGGVPPGGDPSAVLYGGVVVHVYVVSNQGHIYEYVNDGLRGNIWNAYDLTVVAGTGVSASGTPSAVTLGTNVVHVYVRTTSNHLVEFLDDQARGRVWNSYDLSQVAGGGATIGFDPAAMTYGGSGVHVYAGGPDPSTPTGVGVYGIDGNPGPARAISDGWPIIGDTGGLGTTAPPYTATFSNGDLATGQAIQGSGRAVTWLSFWTVSGPVDGNGNLCASASCFYQDTYGAGRAVASKVDGYAQSGLTVKPNFLIIDPEGYPDLHSGLDSGPGSTPANWAAYLQGWSDGIRSVDSSLTPGFYADQSEYRSFGLTNVGLSAFIAVAFPSPVLFVSGANIYGYIAWGATCPAGSEESTLNGWGGMFNTLQFSGAYCGP